MAKTGSKPTDELIRLAMIGDGTAFTALWDTNIAGLKAYLVGVMKIKDAFFVDDICSRSFEKAFRQIASFDPSKSRFSTWLRTIAHNTALDILESENRSAGQTVPLDISAHPAQDEAISGGDSALDTIISQEDSSNTLRLIEGLPELYREIARLRFVEGCRYDEIASETGVELNTVRTRLRRAKMLMGKNREIDEDI